MCGCCVYKWQDVNTSLCLVTGVETIKLMNPKRKKGILHQFGSGSDIQYEVITAFSGEDVYCMCSG